MKESSFKPVNLLSEDDFRASALWEYALDETQERSDETWVRPLPRRTVPKGAYSILTLAYFTLADGRSALGFMNVSTEGQVVVDPGALVAPYGYIPLPATSRETAEEAGYPWVLNERDELTRRLDGREQDVFPIRYVLGVHISGERQPRSGVVS